MEAKLNGIIDYVQGEMDKILYSIFAVKELGYILIMMSTYSTHHLIDYIATRITVDTNQNIEFLLNNVFQNYFQHCYTINDHNRLHY